MARKTELSIIILYGISITSATAKASGQRSLMFRLSWFFALDPPSVNPVLPLKPELLGSGKSTKRRPNRVCASEDYLSA